MQKSTAPPSSPQAAYGSHAYSTFEAAHSAAQHYIDHLAPAYDDFVPLAPLSGYAAADTAKPDDKGADGSSSDDLLSAYATKATQNYIPSLPVSVRALRESVVPADQSGGLLTSYGDTKKADAPAADPLTAYGDKPKDPLTAYNNTGKASETTPARDSLLSTYGSKAGEQAASKDKEDDKLSGYSNAPGDKSGSGSAISVLEHSTQGYRSLSSSVPATRFVMRRRATI